MKFRMQPSLEKLMNSPKLDKDGWVGFDLDGTLATYEGWKGWQHIGKPTPLLKKAMLLMKRGVTVKILTARCSKVSLAKSGITFEQMEKVIQDWTYFYTGQRLPVVTEKDCDMICFYDDSAVQVEQNTGNIVGQDIPVVLGDEEDYNQKIEDHDLSEVSGRYEWNEVKLGPDFLNDFVDGLVHGGFTDVSNLRCRPNSHGFSARNDKTVVWYILDTFVGHLPNENDTVWLCLEIQLANGRNRMIIKLDNLNFKALGNWAAKLAQPKTSTVVIMPVQKQ